MAIGVFCIICTGPVESEDPPAESIFDQALKEAGSDRSDLTVPEPWEDGFVTAARLPAVLDGLANPLCTAPFAQVFGARFSGSRDTVSPEKLLDNAFEMMNIDRTREQPFKAEPLSLIDSLEQLQASHNKGLIDVGYRQLLGESIATWPEDLEAAISILVQAMTKASLLREKALSSLTPEEVRNLTESIVLQTKEPSFQNGHVFLTGVDDVWSNNCTFFSKIDFSALFTASSIMCDAVEMTRSLLKPAATNLPARPDNQLLDFRSAIGQIVVSGPGIDFHSVDAALLVDLGGNDIYINNAGGYSDSLGGIACLIDMSGNDLYDCQKPGSIGGAIVGVGICVDYDGNDVYRGGSISQGSVLGGVGLLYDEDGNDSYQANFFCQGAAGYGIGLSVDVSGDDTLVCRSIGQGFGTTLGLGVLVNVSGHDSYVAGPDFSAVNRKERSPSVFAQGAGAGFQSPDKTNRISYFGGLGFLVDRKGNDQYLAGNFSQGAARFAAIGMLLDCEGGDMFQAENFSQGTAMDWSSAVLIDQQGNDVFSGADSVQGTGINHSTGILLDYDGDDDYSFTGQHGQGHARESFSMGLLLDYRGFDRYSGGPFSRGSVINEYRDTGHILGLFIDHRGKDTYALPDDQPGSGEGPGSNNTIWSRNYGEVGIDTPLTPELYFVNERAQSRYQHYDMSPVLDLEDGVGLSRLGSGDPFASHFALGQVISKGKEIVPAVIKAMPRGHDPFRRTMEEGLGQILLQNFDYTVKEIQLMPLLDNLDPKTRQWCLVQLGRHVHSSMSDILLPKLKDPDSCVRKTATLMMGRIDHPETESALIQIAVHDEDPGTRLVALNALANLYPQENLWIFRTAIGDSNLAIHRISRDHLLSINDTDSIGFFKLLTTDQNPYVRFSAATALIQMGQTSGIPVLIDAIGNVNHYRSPHDSTQLLSEFLSEYTGMNFGWNVAAWKQWWIDQEISFSLPEKLQARDSYLALIDTVMDQNPEFLLRSLDQLRKKYSKYYGFDRRLAPYVRAAAKTAFMEGSQTIAEKLIDYSLEMNQADPESWALQSQILFKSDDIEGAVTALTEALRIEPDNSHYHKLQDVYQGTGSTRPEQQEEK